MSRVRLKKPLLCDDMMYGTDSVLDVKDEGRVRYLVGMDHMVLVDGSTPLTATPPPLPPKRNEQADDIGNAVGRAILKVLNLPKDDQDAA